MDNRYLTERIRDNYKLIKKMKMIIKVVAIAISMLTYSSCDKQYGGDPKPRSTSINKIMPLGASRVEGARPQFESFRYELWKDLKQNDKTFDFIGTQSDQGSYPSFNGSDFDIDHEGRGGWTSGDILDGLADWLEETGAPDIVLFSSPGGNDALRNLPYDKTISNINRVIDALQMVNPNVTIIIEQLAPGRSSLMTPVLTNYFQQLQEDITAISMEQSTSSSQVVVVDMVSNFTDAMLADDVHYNEVGADFIASRYYDILVTVLE